VAGVLRVPGAFAEAGADVPRVAAELATALTEMAAWQGLDGVVVGERGDLAAPLAAALRPARASAVARCDPASAPGDTVTPGRTPG
jgi:hypothetical protein